MEIKLMQSYARIEAIKIQVEALKAANKQRELNGESLAWPASTFGECANEIFNIVEEMGKLKEQQP